MAGLTPSRAVRSAMYLAMLVSACAAAPATRPAGMVWIEPQTFAMGAVAKDSAARADESPAHRVALNGFWIDETEVTNAQFKKFVDATGYVTTAELKPDWTEIRKQLPPGTPKPPEDVLVAGSLVFIAPAPAAAREGAAWWQWIAGASWRHPEGPSSSIEKRMDHPVVQVSWEDAVAYAKWCGKRLPTEAEWECAARASRPGTIYTWGDEAIDKGAAKANTWQGEFPVRDTAVDGFAGTAPVKSFPPNAIGLFDLSGNVWEWTADWYRADTFATDAARGADGAVENPKGPNDSLDPDEPLGPKRVVRGGSFLCHASYCASYRISARMKTSPDTSLSHTGFRCVADAASPTTR